MGRLLAVLEVLMHDRDKAVHALTAAGHLLEAAAHLVMTGKPADKLVKEAASVIRHAEVNSPEAIRGDRG